VTATTKRAPGRPKTPLDVAEREALIRVAVLAANIMETLRLPEYRGRYSSEAELKRWVADRGHRFTSSDFSPALWLLADTGGCVVPLTIRGRAAAVGLHPPLNGPPQRPQRPLRPQTMGMDKEEYACCR
jgi:hypothetical protein